MPAPLEARGPHSHQLAKRARLIFSFGATRGDVRRSDAMGAHVAEDVLHPAPALLYTGESGGALCCFRIGADDAAHLASISLHEGIVEQDSAVAGSVLGILNRDLCGRSCLQHFHAAVRVGLYAADFPQHVSQLIEDGNGVDCGAVCGLTIESRD